MRNVNERLSGLLAALSLVAITGGTALADDTELFIAGEDNSSVNTEARPNILFVIDTSGSMTSQVLTQSAWDPNLEFSGCYRSDAVYWSYNNQAPACGSNRWFRKSANQCEASQQPLATLGEWSGQVLEWRRNNRRPWRSRWRELRTNHNRDRECADDAGLHGSAPGAFWAADGSAGPWSGNDNNEPAWTTTYHLFDGNRLNWLQSDGTVVSSRIDVVKDVTNQLLDSLNNVNVGLMRFNFSQGGPVIHAMEDIATARAGMKAAVDALPASGWTPLSETLYEAGQYFAGRSVDYGQGNGVNSVAESRVGGTLLSSTYNSPIDFACQKNYIVFLSDGEPTQDRDAENRIEGLPGFQSAVGPACRRLPGAWNDDGKCFDEMAEYMYKRDLSDEFFGPQNVTTYTIGFAMDLPILEAAAQKSGGQYYRADDTTTLASALTKIVVSILDDASTFTAPSVPVNAFNRTQNLDDIFVSVFNPSSTVNWPGNLKKYRLANGKFIDANTQLAVDPETGFFTSTAQSFWSSSPDGDRPRDGGAAEQLPAYDDRNLYTDVAGGALTSTGNVVTPDNTAITGAMLGGASTSDEADYDDGLNMNERERIIMWLRGMDLFDDNDNGEITDTRRVMGDPLHVRPVPVIYGGTADDPDMAIYLSTNDGILHAVDPSDGSELWAYIPSEMLEYQQTRYLDPVSPQKLYGLDGEITAVILNDDKKGGITGDERVILVFGMRRGGDGYYAVEVTDRENPELLWKIDSSTTGFGDLGQTWSTPQAAKVRTGDGTTEVIFFGGGYDPVQDVGGYRTDNQGNAVYMVDVETGDLMWSAGQDSSHDLVLPGMEHGVPAPIRVADLNADGLASRLYFGDMGGRVWRIDILNGNSRDELAKGGMLASLGAADLDSPTSADMRRFYNQADIVDVYTREGTRFMAVNIGSGYRAHPLDRQTDEQSFSIRDWAVSTVPENEDYDDPVLFDDTIDISSGMAINMDSSQRGWRVPLVASSGEKVLSRAITFSGTIFFTTFSPGSGANACTAVAGQNRLYAISLFSGESVFGDQPYIDLAQGGIAPQVELLYVPEDGDDDGREEGKLIALIGTEDVELTVADPLDRTYWTQDGAQ